MATNRFAGSSSFEGDVDISGQIYPPRVRSELLASETVIDWIPLGQFRCWDTASQLLPATAANDDLGYTHGTLATNQSYITAGDVKTLTGNRYGRIQWHMKPTYVSAQAASVVIICGMTTTVAATSCDIDVQAYIASSDAITVVGGTDICATSLQSMNSLTFATKTFTLTATNLVAGSPIDFRLNVAYVDAATGTAVIPNILKVGIQQVVKGG